MKQKNFAISGLTQITNEVATDSVSSDGTDNTGPKGFKYNNVKAYKTRVSRTLLAMNNTNHKEQEHLLYKSDLVKLLYAAIRLDDNRDFIDLVKNFIVGNLK